MQAHHSFTNKWLFVSCIEKQFTIFVFKSILKRCAELLVKFKITVRLYSQACSVMLKHEFIHDNQLKQNGEKGNYF